MSAASLGPNVLGNVNVASCISAFLTPAERSAAKGSRLTSIAMSHPPVSAFVAKWDESSFKAKFGEIFPSDRGTGGELNNEARRIAEREKIADWISGDGIPIPKEDHFVFQRFRKGTRWARFVKQVRYYTGYEYAALMKNFGAQTDRKLAQFDHLQNSPIPQHTIAAIRDRCVRGLTISKELDGLKAATRKMERMLNHQTQNLPWLVRKVCLLVQSILFFFMKTDQHVKNVIAASNLMSKDKEGFIETGRLDDLRRGRTKNSPDNCWGIQIGQAKLTFNNQEETYGVYILPTLQGTVSINLSTNGRDLSGQILSTGLRWTPSNSCLPTIESDGNRYGSLRERRLCCSSGVIDYVGQDRTTGDRPMMRVLAQTIVELFERSNESLLEYVSSHADSEVFLCCGFKMGKNPLLTEPQTEQGIRDHIQAERNSGRRFPDPSGNYSGYLHLAKQNGSVLDQSVDFGEWGDPITWRELIQKNPIFPPAEGNFWPDYWVNDPRPYETDRPVAHH